LKENGFRRWSKKDFNNFIDAVIKHGKKAYSEISKEIGTKTHDEIRRYSHSFFSK